MKCRICDTACEPVFSGKIRRIHTARYNLCGLCGLLQIENPFWLPEAYADAINLEDTGILLRNLSLARITTLLLTKHYSQAGKYLDYAGGYGIFTRLMRDIGFDFYWTDVYTQNLLARGFEYNPSIGRIDLLTCFETFEHLVNPLPEIEKMLHISREILLSTTLLPSPLPSPEKWTYFGLSHGQHVSFYAKHTLEFIAHRYGLNFYTNGDSIHLFTSRIFRKNFLRKLSAASSGKRFERIQRRMKGRTSEDSLMMAELRSREA